MLLLFPIVKITTENFNMQWWLFPTITVLKFNNLILSEILLHVSVNIRNFKIKLCNDHNFFNEFGYYYISDIAWRDYLNLFYAFCLAWCQ